MKRMCAHSAAIAFIVVLAVQCLAAGTNSQLIGGVAGATQVEILKKQLEIIEKYDALFLTVVLSSLGGLFALAVLLVGYNLFTNLRSYERDKASIKQELVNVVEEHSNTLNRNFQGWSQDSLSKIRTEITAQLDQKSQQILTQLGAEVTKLNSRIANLRNDVYDIQIKQLGEDVRLYLHGELKVPSNAARNCAAMLELAVRFRFLAD